MEKREGELKLIRVTNPNYIGRLGPFINDFINKIKPIGITYETLYTYFANSVQFGREQTEFWIANYDDKPTAFSHWLVMPSPPYTGVVCCDYIYSWNRKSEPIEMLLKEFIKFGQKNRCPIYKGYAINETLFRVWRRAAKRLNFGIKKLDIVTFIGRK